MSRINIKFAELHNPLFLAGTNLGAKLQPHNRTGMVLEYDLESSWLLVQFNGAVAIVPEANISSMTPISPQDIGVTLAGTANHTPTPVVTHVSHPMTAGIDRAQVSSPMNTVQNPSVNQLNSIK